MARVLFIIVPILILVLGIFLIVSAANFWIASNGVTQTLSLVAYSSQNSDLSVTIFYPEIFSPKVKNQVIEIEVENRQRKGQTINQLETSVIDTCEYLRLDKTLHTFDLTSNATIFPPTEAIISSRSIRPPTSCEFEVKVLANGTVLEEDSFRIYINAWVGHTISLLKTIAGLLISLGSLRGAIAAIGI